MYAVSRSFFNVGSHSAAASATAASSHSTTDYLNSASLTDAFHTVQHRANWTFDHILIDVPSIIGSVAYQSRDLMGSERDRETVRNVQRQLQATLLRRLQAKKSLALLFDGAEPMWQLERLRLFPGRRYDTKFYRSAASPMPYMLEEKIRAAAMEQRVPPPETLVSGPATPGTSEGKISAYLLDLSTRLLQPPSYPAYLCPQITANDSICLVGRPELAWLGIGMTPFRHITTVTPHQGELQACSLHESMEWLRLGHLLGASASASTAAAAVAAATTTSFQPGDVDAPKQPNRHGAEGAEETERLTQQRLAAARTDLVLLYLLAHGHATTGLSQVLSTPFADLLDAYKEVEEADQAAQRHEFQLQRRVSQEGGVSVARTPRFRSVLFDEEPVTVRQLDRPPLRLRLQGLQRVLYAAWQESTGAGGAMGGVGRMASAGAGAAAFPGASSTTSASSPAAPSPYPAGSKPTAHAATLLELALQTHGLLCAGGVYSQAWTPTPENSANTALVDKFPKLSLEQLLQHVGYLVKTSAATLASAADPATEAGPKLSTSATAYLSPQVSRTFALTGAEALLLSATQAEQLQQLLPLYARGHTLPEGVAEDIVGTRNIHAALRKTQQVMGPVVAQAEKEMTNAAAHLATPTNGSGNDAAKRDAEGHLTIPHPALTHLPSHLFARAARHPGPPPGWVYYGVHLGIKAEAMNARYSLNAVDASTLRGIDTSGLPRRDTLFVWMPKPVVEDPVLMGRHTTAKQTAATGEKVPLSATAGTWLPTACVNAGRTAEAAEADTSKRDTPSDTLRVVTWNSQFNRHSGKNTPLGREGIDWCTPTRHVAAAKVLEATDADVICLQEVEPEWVAYLSAQSWVRERYALTAVATSPQLIPSGVLMLVRKRGVGTCTSVRHVTLPVYAEHTHAMPEVTLRLGTAAAPIVIAGLHLLAPYNNTNEGHRAAQLANLEKHLASVQSASIGELGAASGETKAESVSHLLVGDFNDFPAKLYRLPDSLGYKDAWELLNPHCQQPSASSSEKGYTIDGQANPYTQKLIEPRFFGRPDRILVQSRHVRPTSAELIGTAKVTAVLPPDEKGRHVQVDKPSELVPEYLYPSDHFGVLVEFRVVEERR